MRGIVLHMSVSLDGFFEAPNRPAPSATASSCCGASERGLTTRFRTAGLAVTDQGAGQLKQPPVDVGSASVADGELPEGVQPGEGSLDDPALAAQAGAVGDAAPSDGWGDAALAE
jgi:hypothetical protein